MNGSTDNAVRDVARKHRVDVQCDMKNVQSVN